MTKEQTSAATLSITPDAAGPMTRFQFLVVLWCSLATLVEGFDTQAVGFVAPAISADWGVPVSAFGLVFASSVAGLMLGAPLLGLLADARGRRGTLLAALALVGASMIVCAFARSMPELMAARFVTGIGIGGTLPSAASLVAEYAPRRLRNTMVTIVVSGFALGAVLGGILSAYLTEAYGWRSVLLAAGVLPLVLGALLFFVLPESAAFLQARDPGGRRLEALLRKTGPIAVETSASARSLGGSGILFGDGRTPVTLLLWALMILNLASVYLLINWLPTMFGLLGFGAAEAILGSALFALAGLIGGLVLALLLERPAHRAALPVFYAVSALALAGLTQAQALPASWVLALAAIAGFTVSGAQHALASIVANFYPAAGRSTGLGFATAIGRTGTILALVAGGALLARADGLSLVFTGLAAAGILAAAGAAAVIRRLPD